MVKQSRRPDAVCSECKQVIAVGTKVVIRPGQMYHWPWGICVVGGARQVNRPMGVTAANRAFDVLMQSNAAWRDVIGCLAVDVKIRLRQAYIKGATGYDILRPARGAR